ncbi:hypothetical protein TWF569_007072 [Orbilia oligospora]|uniref:Uncharacterized protein n=1 Tax=Orbilia oligospora TaxID=2813651 RepID=A0A7C8NRC2_ORBOL|nr:hypothetical protein TWF103_008051 [Orbilia oligospora]KAF3102393.1 hypothetical protein TWF102_004594 [Orbilia oligospora]KAF3144391.1 hypothetical protein TWF569_007072 [Orbilia oligospora]
MYYEPGLVVRNPEILTWSPTKAEGKRKEKKKKKRIKCSYAGFITLKNQKNQRLKRTPTKKGLGAERRRGAILGQHCDMLQSVKEMKQKESNDHRAKLDLKRD